MSNKRLKILNGFLLLIGILCIMAVVLLIILNSAKNTNRDILGASSSDSTFGIQESPHTINTNDALENNYNEHLMEIYTPYCTLQYPNLWPDNFKYTEKTEDNIYSLTFYSNIKGIDYEMFTIWFGAPEMGSVIGYLDFEGRQVSFSISINNPITVESWSEQEVELINLMTEAVNDVLISVYSCEGFSKALK